MERDNEEVGEMGDLLEALDARLEKRDAKIDKRFETLEQKLDKRFDKVDERFDKVDERFDKVDERFVALDEKSETRTNALRVELKDEIVGVRKYVFAFLLVLLTAALGALVAMGEAGALNL